MRKVVGHIEFAGEMDPVTKLLGITQERCTQVHEILSIAEQDLKDRWVVLKENVLKPKYRTAFHRVLKATGGFGCSPNTLGSAVFTQGLDGSEDRWERYDIMGLLDDRAAEAFVKACAPKTDEVAELGYN